MGIENPLHLLFLAVVALLVLGPKRLPGLAKALGDGIREFRESINVGEDRETPSSPNGVQPPAAAAAVPVPPPDAPAEGTQETPPGGAA